MSRERVISSSSAPLATPPLAIPFPSLSRSSSSLPDSLQSLCSQRLLVDAALNSPSLATELADGTVGPHINQVRRQLEEIIQQASVWKTKVRAFRSTRPRSTSDRRKTHALNVEC